ncbi:MAG TPA: lytic transglycosylase domain-containing protein [Thermoanaerobaculia bacterium]
MAELKTKRPYQERFLDGFDRTRLRQEVQATKPRGLKGLKRKYATWALGASLALGGIGGPLKMIQDAQDQSPKYDPAAAEATMNPSNTMSIDRALAGDVKRAESIASQVAGGVLNAADAAVGGVESAVKSPLKTIAEAPRKLTVVTESVRKDFFHKEVPFGSIIYAEAKKNNLRPELVAAVVQAESRFKPTARSGAGAVGLMQLVPRTGRWMGARDLTNPVQNIQAGTKYLKYLNERFDGNETKVIAAYNAGEGNVKRFGGVPPFKETRKYVSKVRNYEQEFHDRVEGRVADMTVAEAR